MEAAAKRAEAVKDRYQRELLSKANVVGVGIGYRRTRGELTGEIGLVVMVSRKVPRERLDAADLVPGRIEDVPVDVQEVGELQAG